ncbi:MAG: hypothetical protein ACI8TA_002849 [Cyclobacteriaceae bacterium]|jgi:hypothetical protein
MFFKEKENMVKYKTHAIGGLFSRQTIVIALLFMDLIIKTSLIFFLSEKILMRIKTSATAKNYSIITSNIRAQQNLLL